MITKESMIPAAVFFLLIAFPLRASAEVKIYLDETRKEYVMAQEMDCTVHRSSGGITIGFKAGNFLFGFGPEVTFGKQGITWDKAVQAVIARYQELCARFNTGSITQKEYDARLREIDALAKEVTELQQKLLKQTKQSAKESFAELQRETSKDQEAISERIDEISTKAENLRTVPQIVPQVESREDGVKVVISEGTAILGDDKTIGQVRAIALNNARRRALEDAVGVAVRATSVLYNHELVSDLILISTKGLIVKEEPLESGTRPDGSQLSYYTKIRAHIKPLNLERRGSFKIVKAEVYRVGGTTKPPAPVFHEDDELQIRLMASESVFLHVFSVSQDGRLYKILPNEFSPNEKLPAGAELVIPDESLRNRGVRLRVKVPPKAAQALESVLLLATKSKQNFLLGKVPEETTITDLMQELSEIDPSEWTDKTLGYEVRR